MGVEVAHGRDDCEGDGLGVEGPTSGAPSDPATAPGAGVLRDGLGARWGAPGEQPSDLGRKLGPELEVLLGAALLVALATTTAGLLVGTLSISGMTSESFSGLA